MTREEAQTLIEEIKRDDNVGDNYQYCITAEGFVDWMYEHGFIIVSETEFYGDYESEEELSGYRKDNLRIPFDEK
jgi:hypothetical protein